MKNKEKIKLLVKKSLEMKKQGKLSNEIKTEVKCYELLKGPINKYYHKEILEGGFRDRSY